MVNTGPDPLPIGQALVVLKLEYEYGGHESLATSFSQSSQKGLRETELDDRHVVDHPLNTTPDVVCFPALDSTNSIPTTSLAVAHRHPPIVLRFQLVVLIPFLLPRALTPWRRLL